MKPRVVVLVGLPASGKSTWAAKQKHAAISSDAIRQLLADDETEQGIHARVFAMVRQLLRERLKLGRPVTYIDATNLRPWERKPYIKIAAGFAADVEAVFFDVPLEECLQRNARRDRKVPEDAVRKMAGVLVPPDRAEGFVRVRRVRA